MARKFALLTLVLLGFGLVLVTPARAADAILKAHLTGAAERPGPGDPDGAGDATIYIDDDTDRLCARVTYSNVDGTPTGMHIHRAPPTSAGPVVVALAPPSGGRSFQCVSVADEALLDDIAANPQEYYVNLHSTIYPAGAIRGQLGNL